MKKSYILIGVFLIFVIFISIIGSVLVTGKIEIEKENDILVVQQNKEVYFNVYGYDIENPNVIVNPYGNSPLTAIVMFSTDDYSNVKVTIKSKDGNSDIVYKFGKDKYHMIPIYGLYADYDNTVIIESEGLKKIIKIKTDKLPSDFEYVQDMVKDNFVFYNNNYPYAIDSNGEVRWYLNEKYYGNITITHNSSIIIGSNRYNEEGNTISFYKMNLLGKIYNEYLFEESYYGYNCLYEDNLLVLSDKIMLVDIQTGEIISEYGVNNEYNYLGCNNSSIIVGKDNLFYEIDNDSLNEVKYDMPINKFSFYDRTSNYKIIPNNRFGILRETSVSKEKINIVKYEKIEEDADISFISDVNRIKIINNTDNNVYLILDKFLDKRIYEVDDIKYINYTGLDGKYTIYLKIDGIIYKTDYFVEV